MPQLTYRSKKDYVYGSLRAEILSGCRKPGSRLIIDDLAAELGVSPIPVREALQGLQADGYVVIQPYVGAKVAEMQIDSVHEIFALLEAMEVVSGRAACERMTDQDLGTLEEIISRMDGLVDDPEAWSRENLALHEFICTCAGSFLTEALLRKAMEHWDRLRRYYFADVFTHRVRQSQEEHREILTALRSRDLAVVERVIRVHNQQALAAYVTHLCEVEA
ncbi:MAG: GntR family transcriptional regulator [Deinococcota bacterium]|nr:GntR family transcriptional regulator [Deinococcota bacterium]MDQ3458985.1 GntR family transcriptional regulator [Deinococcota bacterium]